MNRSTVKEKPQTTVRPAEVVREYGPLSEAIHGVTHDGRRVWAATGSTRVAFDPASGEVVRTLARAGDAGTAFDGTYLYQIAEAQIDPETGAIVRAIESNRFVTGVTWVDGAVRNFRNPDSGSTS